MQAELLESLKQLIRVGLELGVSEAARKMQEIVQSQFHAAPADQWNRLLKDADLGAWVEAIKQDPSSVLHLVKEVWSRGGPKEKKVAAETVGRALAVLVPHKALQVARELAGMARNPKEADWVGQEAIGPILAQNPAMFDRIKQFLAENHVWIRRAAISGVVFLVARKRKYAATALEIVLLVAESYEKEIREGVRWAIREIGRADPKAAAATLVTWVKSNPTRERVQTAVRGVSSRADAALLSAQKTLYTQLAKFAEGGLAAPKAAPRRRVRRAVAAR